MKIQILLIIGLLASSLFVSSCSDDGNSTPIGNIENLGVAPDFSIKTWEGNDLKLETYKDKVLVIFFFGNTCPPCIGVGPAVEEKLNQNLKSKSNYAIIGIDQWDGNNASVEGFQKNTGVEFPLGVIGSPVAKAYDTTYDRLVVVNKEGNIIFRGNNIVSNHLDEVVTLVNNLLD